MCKDLESDQLKDRETTETYTIKYYCIFLFYRMLILF